MIPNQEGGGVFERSIVLKRIRAIMSKPKSSGTCNLCGKTFGRAAMTRHLGTCSLLPDPAGSVRETEPGFHLLVQPRYNKDYWMHLAAPVEAPLSRLDAFLRDIWLECCGHLSAFTIDGTQYVSQDARELGDRGMGARLRRLLQPGMLFTYEYDFGSTTELHLKVLAVREQIAKGGAIELLARNDEPAVTCQRCGGRPATQICSECDCRGDGWMCQPCAEEHECGTEMCLPVGNSPRAGVCGYCG